MKIDNSQLNSFINCPRAYYNRYILKLGSLKEDDRDSAKNFGSSLHKALETYYKGGSLEQSTKAFNESFNPIEGDLLYTPNHGIELIEAYIKYYSAPTNELGDNYLTTLITKEGNPAIEIKDSFMIDDVEWIVKIDRIVKSNAGILGQDHKSTQKSLYTFISKFTPNMQFSGYTAYIMEKYGQCGGIIPNVLWFGYRKKAYKGELAGFHYQFQRDIVNRTKEQIDDFKQNVLYWTGKLSKCLEDNYWGKNENQCIYCQYKELCTSCNDENVKETLYREIDPLEYLK